MADTMQIHFKKEQILLSRRVTGIAGILGSVLPYRPDTKPLLAESMHRHGELIDISVPSDTDRKIVLQLINRLKDSD